MRKVGVFVQTSVAWGGMQNFVTDERRGNLGKRASEILVCHKNANNNEGR